MPRSSNAWTKREYLAVSSECAIVTVVVNGRLVGEIYLEHGPEALTMAADCCCAGRFRASPQSQRRQWRVVSLCAPPVDSKSKIRGDYFHCEAMSVERAVVQNHMVAPAHAVEDGARSGDGADWKACAEVLCRMC